MSKKAKGKKQPKQKKEDDAGDFDPNAFNIYREIRTNFDYGTYPIE
jgi:hypothetical protein